MRESERSESVVLAAAAALVTVVLCCCAGGVSAATSVFSGPSSGDWNTASYWNPSGIPGPNDVALMTGKTPQISAPVVIGALYMGGGGGLSFTIGGSMNISGLLFCGGPSAYGFNLNNGLGFNTYLAAGAFNFSQNTPITFTSGGSSNLPNVYFGAGALFASPPTGSQITINGVNLHWGGPYGPVPGAHVTMLFTNSGTKPAWNLLQGTYTGTLTVQSGVRPRLFSSSNSSAAFGGTGGVFAGTLNVISSTAQVTCSRGLTFQMLAYTGTNGGTFVFDGCTYVLTPATLGSSWSVLGPDNTAPPTTTVVLGGGPTGWLVNSMEEVDNVLTVRGPGSWAISPTVFSPNSVIVKDADVSWNWQSSTQLRGTWACTGPDPVFWTFSGQIASSGFIAIGGAYSTSPVCELQTTTSNFGVSPDIIVAPGGTWRIMNSATFTSSMDVRMTGGAIVTGSGATAITFSSSILFFLPATVNVAGTITLTTPSTILTMSGFGNFWTGDLTLNLGGGQLLWSMAGAGGMSQLSTATIVGPGTFRPSSSATQNIRGTWSVSGGAVLNLVGNGGSNGELSIRDPNAPPMTATSFTLIAPNFQVTPNNFVFRIGNGGKVDGLIGNNGAGTVILDGCTLVNGGAVSSSTVLYGPSAQNITTVFQYSTSISIPNLLQVKGTILMNGAGDTVSLPALELLPSGVLDIRQRFLSFVSLVQLSGQIIGGNIATPPLVTFASGSQVNTGRALVVNSTLYPTGALQVAGPLGVLGNVTFARTTLQSSVSLTGPGAVVLRDAAFVSSGAALSASTIVGAPVASDTISVQALVGSVTLPQMSGVQGTLLAVGSSSAQLIITALTTASWTATVVGMGPDLSFGAGTTWKFGGSVLHGVNGINALSMSGAITAGQNVTVNATQGTWNYNTGALTVNQNAVLFCLTNVLISGTTQSIVGLGALAVWGGTISGTTSLVLNLWGPPNGITTTVSITRTLPTMNYWGGTLLVGSGASVTLNDADVTGPPPSMPWLGTGTMTAHVRAASSSSVLVGLNVGLDVGWTVSCVGGIPIRLSGSAKIQSVGASGFVDGTWAALNNAAKVKFNGPGLTLRNTFSYTGVTNSDVVYQDGVTVQGGADLNTCTWNVDGTVGQQPVTFDSTTGPLVMPTTAVAPLTHINSAIVVLAGPNAFSFAYDNDASTTLQFSGPTLVTINGQTVSGGTWQATQSVTLVLTGTMSNAATLSVATIVPNRVITVQGSMTVSGTLWLSTGTVLNGGTTLTGTGILLLSGGTVMPSPLIGATVIVQGAQAGVTTTLTNGVTLPQYTSVSGTTLITGPGVTELTSARWNAGAVTLIQGGNTQGLQLVDGPGGTIASGTFTVSSGTASTVTITLAGSCANTFTIATDAGLVTGTNVLVTGASFAVPVGSNMYISSAPLMVSAVVSGSGTLWLQAGTITAGASLTTASVRGPVAGTALTLSPGLIGVTINNMMFDGSLNVTATGGGVTLNTLMMTSQTAMIISAGATVRITDTNSLLAGLITTTGDCNTQTNFTLTGKVNGALTVRHGGPSSGTGSIWLTASTNVGFGPNGVVNVLNGVSVGSGAKLIGTSGTPTLTLDGCTVQGGTTINVNSIIGPSASSTTTFDLQNALLAVTASLGVTWTGTVAYTGLGASAALQFPAGAVTWSTASSTPVLAYTGSGATCGTNAPQVSGNFLMSGVGVSASFIGTCVAATGGLFIASTQTTAVVKGSFDTTTGGVLFFGAGAVQTVIHEATTVTGFPSGVMTLSSAVVRGGTYTPGVINGPTSASLVVTFDLSAGPVTLSAFRSWTGIVQTKGTSALTLSGVTMASSAQLVLGGANVQTVSVSMLAGSNSFVGFITTSQTPAGTTQQLQLTGSVLASNTLRLQNNPNASPIGTIALTGGTVTAGGVLQLLSGVTVSGGTIGNSGIGTVLLDGCLVTGGTFVAATVAGPCAGNTTTFQPAGAGYTLAALKQVAGTVNVQGANGLVITAVDMTAATATIRSVSGQTITLGGNVRGTLMGTGSTFELSASVLTSTTLAFAGGVNTNLPTISSTSVLTVYGTLNLAGALVAAGAFVGNGAPGTVNVGGALVQSNAAIDASTIVGPSATQTTILQTPLYLARMWNTAGNVTYTGTGLLQVADLQVDDSSVPGGSVNALLWRAVGSSATLNAAISMPGTFTVLSVVSLFGVVVPAVTTLSVSGNLVGTCFVRTPGGSVSLGASTSVLLLGVGLQAGTQFGTSGTGSLQLSGATITSAAALAHAGDVTANLPTTPSSSVSLGSTSLLIASLTLRVRGTLVVSSASSAQVLRTGNLLVDSGAVLNCLSFPGKVDATGTSSGVAGTVTTATGTLTLTGSGSFVSGTIGTSTGATVELLNGASCTPTASLAGGGLSATLRLGGGAVVPSGVNIANIYSVEVQSTGAVLGVGYTLTQLTVAGTCNFDTAPGMIVITGGLTLDATATPGAVKLDVVPAGAAVVTIQLQAPSAALALQLHPAGDVTLNRMNVVVGGNTTISGKPGVSALVLSGGTQVTANNNVRLQYPATATQIRIGNSAGGRDNGWGGGERFSMPNAQVIDYSGAIGPALTNMSLCVSAPLLAPLLAARTQVNAPRTGCAATDLFAACYAGPCSAPGYAVCNTLQTGFTCSCNPGYAGVTCQTDVNECASNPCANGGVCTDLVNAFSCACALGFTGPRCQTNINECASNPCRQVGSTCVDGNNAFTCSCAAGYAGPVCQTDINECASNPCTNGGTCTDLPNAFSCACASGYNGARCQTNINECASQPCMNGATCIDGLSSWSCTCRTGFLGNTCQTNVNECVSQPCINGGTCVDGVNAFTCSCAVGWTGWLCQTQIYVCSSYPCRNGAECEDHNTFYNCNCLPGFTGRICETDINECASNPCLRGAPCTDLPNGFSCACPAGYNGNQCQTDIDECASRPCQNGAISCTDLVNGYACQCAPGFLGTNCQTDINECASNPCFAGQGACVDSVNGFSCACVNGYSGLRCQTNVNECASQPCRNGGTCTDGVNGFTCGCKAGFNGVLCQTDINECASQPCQNGALCTDRIASFNCTCVPGYSGVLCQTNINECASIPCQNGGTCTDFVNQYSCNCGTSGFSGAQCQTDINECAVNNGGCGSASLCTNLVPGFNCSAFIIPGSLTSPTAASTDPLVLTAIDNQQLELVVSAVGQNIAQLSLTVGRVEKKNMYACTSLIVFGPNNLAWQQMRCYLAPGVGGNLHAYLWRNGLVVSSSNDTFSYPAPVITDGSLRRNSSSYEPTKVSTLQLDTALAAQIQFDGRYFFATGAATDLQVYYGPEYAPTRYVCTLVLAQCTRETVTCITVEGSTGNDNRFTVVTGGGPGVTSANLLLKFPVVPLVLRVTGCPTPNGNGTSDCPTEGGPKITITGENFDQTGLQVVVNGRVCDSADAADPATVTCLLPQGSGTDRGVTVTCSGQQSQPAALVSYVTATLMVIRPDDGSEAAETGGAQALLSEDDDDAACEMIDGTNMTVSGCKREGGDRVILEGVNFGPSGAIVLVGSALGIDVRQSLITPHRKLYMTLPRGVGTDRSILLFQGGGGVAPSSVTMSYAKCPRGTYAQDLNCTLCPRGKYSGVENAAACDVCGQGTYPEMTVGSAQCVGCDIGKSSFGGASVCGECTVGKSQSAPGQADCVPCLEGTYTAVNGSSGCTACDIDLYQPTPGQSTCIPCPDGFESLTTGRKVCSACAAGTFRNSTSGPRCTACPAGKSQGAQSQTHCEDCAAGKSSGERATTCNLCADRYFMPNTGASECKSCPDGASSVTDKQSCSCPTGSYGTDRSLNMACQLCPTGCKCDQSNQFMEDLTTEAGYWRSDNMSLNFLQCLQPGNCVEGKCAPNRDGPLCAVCKPGYSSSSQADDCTECPSQSASLGGTVGFSILILLAVLVILYAVWRMDGVEIKRHNAFDKVKAYTPEDRSRPNYTYNLKILLSYMQIATTLFGLVQIPWPSYFSTFIGYFAFVNLSFIPWQSVACVTAINFYDKLVLIFIVPIVVVALLYLAPTIYTEIRNRWDYSDSSAARNNREKVRLKIIKIIVFALFLLYPAVSASVLSFFICRTVNGTSYLVADFTLQCADSEWNRWLPLAVIAVLVYPIGIPAFIFFGLRRHRKHLRRPDVLLSWGIAYEAFVHQYWWFEVSEMCEKLMLTAILGFFEPEVQCPLGMAIITVEIIVLVLADPYVRRIDGRMSFVVQIHLYLILLCGLVLQQNTFKVGSLEDVLASVLMFLILVTLLIMLIVNGIVFARKYLRNWQRDRALRTAEHMEHNPMAAPGDSGKKGSKGMDDPLSATHSGSGSGDGSSGGGTVSGRPGPKHERQYSALTDRNKLQMDRYRAGSATPHSGSDTDGASPRFGGGQDARVAIGDTEMVSLNALPPPPPSDGVSQTRLMLDMADPVSGSSPALPSAGAKVSTSRPPVLLDDPVPAAGGASVSYAHRNGPAESMPSAVEAAAAAAAPPPPPPELPAIAIVALEPVAAEPIESPSAAASADAAAAGVTGAGDVVVPPPAVEAADASPPPAQHAALDARASTVVSVDDLPPAPPAPAGAAHDDDDGDHPAPPAPESADS